MRAFRIILTVAVTAASGPALAQATPNVVAPTPGLSTPVTSTTTNCVVSCNSQATNCKTACVLPVPTPLPSPSSSAAPQCDTKHGVPDGLYLHSVGVPERMRVDLPLPAKRAANFYRL